MIDPPALVARPPLETRQALTRRDTILYALGVGAHELGFAYEAGLRALPTMAVVLAYPGFFWQVVTPYIGDGLRYLRVTQEGKKWIANLFAHVFAEEHHGAFADR